MKSVKDIEADLRDIVTSLGLSGAQTSVELSESGKWLHIVISCNEFERMSYGERENMIWKKFEEKFDDDTILSITQCYLLSPKEYEEALQKS